MSDDPLYCYPGTHVLRNNLDLTNAEEFDRAERLLSRSRTIEGTPEGNFDLDHLRAIHKHLFQDVYKWAGDIREVEISKDGSQFQFRQYIDTGMADVHRRLVGADYLRGLDAEQFAAKAGEIIGDVNYVHPFREGNGRTQLEYLRQLAVQAGHDFRQEHLDREQWIGASIAAHQGNYVPMGEAIRSAIAPEREIEKDAPGQPSDREAELREKLAERQAKEIVVLEQKHQVELDGLDGATDRNEVLERHKVELEGMSDSHAGDLARRMEDERRAQELMKRLEEERGVSKEQSRSR